MYITSLHLAGNNDLVPLGLTVAIEGHSVTRAVFFTDIRKVSMEDNGNKETRALTYQIVSTEQAAALFLPDRIYHGRHILYMYGRVDLEGNNTHGVVV